MQYARWHRALVSTLMALPLAGLTAGRAWAEDLIFTLVNNASTSLVELYVAPSTSGDWEEDILSEVLLPGYETDVIIADGLATCSYDILAVFNDGTESDARGVDLCEMDTYILED